MFGINLFQLTAPHKKGWDNAAVSAPKKCAKFYSSNWSAPKIFLKFALAVNPSITTETFCVKLPWSVSGILSCPCTCSRYFQTNGLTRMKASFYSFSLRSARCGSLRRAKLDTVFPTNRPNKIIYFSKKTLALMGLTYLLFKNTFQKARQNAVAVSLTSLREGTILRISAAVIRMIKISINCIHTIIF